MSTTVNRCASVPLCLLAMLAVLNTAGAGTPPDYYGTTAMLHLERLPYLASNISSAQQSSYDRTGGNGDAGNYLYSVNGENVMLDLKGPGVVYDLWTTGYNYSSDFLRAYIDGETTPRLNMIMGNLFAGTNAPFLAPLANPDNISSGGFYSYVPIPFSQSIRITCSGGNYYHVGYQTFMPNATVTPWSVTDPVTDAVTQWKQCGTDPTSYTGTTTSQGTATLDADSTVTLLNVDGPREIVSLALKIPELGTIGGAGQQGNSVTDNGRALKGYCQFTAAIDPSNQGVKLTRRLDYGIADQVGSVSVDGATVGNWSTMGSDGTYRWRDSSFSIPSSFTAGKSSITVKVTFVSSSNDWNEFYYWIRSETAGGETLTDTVDVGTTASETAHGYTINNQTWNGTQTFQYPSGVVAPPLDILNNISLLVSYDNEASPSVNAPLGSFFAMGQFGGFATHALMVGVDTTNTLYCFFPMPFARHATVQLSSSRSTATANITYAIVHTAFTDPFLNVGYFKTKFNHAVHTGGDGNDVLFLDTSGSGKFLGVMYSMAASNQGYLEGDERFYIDNNRSPAFHGTGTEDFFQGGWYFDKGQFTLPMHGAPVVSGTDNAAYRFFLQDAVRFRAHFHASIEHGDRDGANEEAWSLAYFYLNPQPSAVCTDSIVMGNSASETAHAYAADSQTWSGSLTSSFEGINDNVSITQSGRSDKGSTFTVSILPGNNGVILRKMFDQNVQPQSASVFVGNSAVGTWYKAGSNTTHRWREDEFMIPAALTSGKNSITISLTHTAGTPDWSEYKYWVFSLTDTASTATFSLKPNSERGPSLQKPRGSSLVAVYTPSGRLVGRFLVSGELRDWNMRRQLPQVFPHGVYVVRSCAGGASYCGKMSW